ncbi:uncharacterized protein LOC118755745 [Rhagoletis pomonella]|uniref:uncharacterized protein LOC118755745 n=1 Tax=Rhagoletis pomonella TaxID=28610 RepID=UPI00177EE026|nr:uncharacterized protein LOC118755745 [Rhagoletis pomonella]
MERQPKTDKILGMYWNSNNDVLEFQFRFHKIPREVIDCKRPPTKRELLGLVMAIYDPFGLLANVTITTKLILQATWKQPIDWDDPLPCELESRWIIWWKAFQDIKHFAVPRCISPIYTTAESLELHVFVDASDTAYAAVRMKKAQEVNVAFIAGKTRCAPKRESTVPRLELQAAVLGSRLKTLVEECLDRTVNDVTFWSDSKMVLRWIRSRKRDFKQFVASRISEVLSVTSSSQWRWIPSAINVADEATKLEASPKCQTDSRWIQGPDFLYDNDNTWPMEPENLYSNPCASEEHNKKIVLIIHNSDIIDITKYSSFIKLQRVVAWVLRFVNNLKSRLYTVVGLLSLTDKCPIVNKELVSCALWVS